MRGRRVAGAAVDGHSLLLVCEERADTVLVRVGRGNGVEASLFEPEVQAEVNARIVGGKIAETDPDIARQTPLTHIERHP